MERTLTTRNEAAARLADFAAAAEECRACPLGSTRTQAVFGVGDPAADIMFVGEAPGFHEDRQGEPFVGAAGQLLTKLIEKHLGLRRDDVYICNVLKCRPPNNRDPLPAEIESCRPFLAEQIELVGPRVVAALGNFAAKLLLQTSTGITRIHGKRFEFGDAILIPVFHPAAALRGGSAAEGIEADFAALRVALDEARAADAESQDEEAGRGEQLGLF